MHGHALYTYLLVVIANEESSLVCVIDAGQDSHLSCDKLAVYMHTSTYLLDLNASTYASQQVTSYSTVVWSRSMNAPQARPNDFPTHKSRFLERLQQLLLNSGRISKSARDQE